MPIPGPPETRGQELATVEARAELLAAAAAESFERIRRDRIRTPVTVSHLLDHLLDHLFDPHLDVNRLKRACGVRDNVLLIRFHAALRRSPRRYIEDRRLETACRLLRDSGLRIWEIAELVGYSGLQVFSRAFQRWSGSPPSAYRRHHAEAAVRATGWLRQ